VAEHDVYAPVCAWKPCNRLMDVLGEIPELLVA
jgi:hypothetical protein